MPVNVAISPDGKTAIIAGTFESKDVAAAINSEATFSVLQINGSGDVELRDLVTIPTTTAVSGGCQSLVFNRAGTKAYTMCTPIVSDPTDTQSKNEVRVLSITAPGRTSDTGISIPVEFYSRGQLFGVDTLSLDNPGNYLYVSNPSNF